MLPMLPMLLMLPMLANQRLSRHATPPMTLQPRVKSFCRTLSLRHYVSARQTRGHIGNIGNISNIGNIGLEFLFCAATPAVAVVFNNIFLNNE